MSDHFLPQPKAHGNICLGLQFTCHGAFYRRCGYDGTLLAQALNGTKCESCQRIVKDTNLCEVYSEPATARMAYLANDKGMPGIWVLVEVPPITVRYYCCDYAGGHTSAMVRSATVDTTVIISTFCEMYSDVETVYEVYEDGKESTIIWTKENPTVIE